VPSAVVAAPASSVASAAAAPPSPAGALLVTEHGVGPLAWAGPVTLESLGRALPGYELYERCVGRCNGGPPAVRGHEVSAVRAAGDGSIVRVGVHFFKDERAALWVNDAMINDPGARTVDGLRPGLEAPFTFDPPLPRDEAVSYQGKAHAGPGALPAPQGVDCYASREATVLRAQCAVAGVPGVMAKFEKSAPPAPEGTLRLVEFTYHRSRTVQK
jgi:hypothetical protein